MVRFHKRRRAVAEEPELNMIPIMNLFMVLIPFLLTSVSFLHIKAINTSVPVHSTVSSSPVEEPSSPKITVVLELQADQVRISTLSDTPNAIQVSAKDWVVKRSPAMGVTIGKVADHLKKVKHLYPASDTMVLVPSDEITYREIVETMDCARMDPSEAMFPNVVLSGTLG